MAPHNTNLTKETPGPRAVARRAQGTGIGYKCRAALAKLSRVGGHLTFWADREFREVDELASEQFTDRSDILPDETARPDLREKFSATAKLLGQELTMSTETHAGSDMSAAMAYLISTICILLPPATLMTGAYLVAGSLWVCLGAGAVGLGVAIWLRKAVHKKH